jgi:inositol-pentakisphosphate 2-kinase
VQSAKLAHFVTWAKTSPLLAQLKRLQVDLDKNGVFASNPEDKDFLTAMTLRDCSVFLHISLKTNSATPITARISDLDLKSPTRVEHWRTIERSLVDGGWYTGTEREENKQPLDCALFPEARTPVAERAALRVLKDKGESC